MRTKTLSVIISAYDSHDVTVVHVKEAMNVSLMPLEIIVVNDGGTPDLLEKLKAIPDKKCDIIYARIREDIPWNYIGAINLATFISRGDYLAFEDNDNIPSFEFYQKAIELFDTRPEIGRVLGRHRKCIDIKEVLSGKPREEWTIARLWHPNQGTAMMRRDIVVAMKGQCEMFCGRYGWMFYNLRRILLNRIKTKFSSVDYYYYVDHEIDGGAQSKLARHSSGVNLQIHRAHTRMPEGQLHLTHGILNFIYDYERIN
jgi:glycosyltransferase involved in cell wall biosynthesis